MSFMNTDELYLQKPPKLYPFGSYYCDDNTVYDNQFDDTGYRAKEVLIKEYEDAGIRLANYIADNYTDGYPNNPTEEESEIDPTMQHGFDEFAFHEKVNEINDELMLKREYRKTLDDEKAEEAEKSEPEPEAKSSGGL
jgi:hypothetical protein